LTSKLAKSANMTKKIQIIWLWVSKNAEFDAEFESVEKVAKVYTKKVIGLRTLVHRTER
jgi:hypothetical protein